MCAGRGVWIDYIIRYKILKYDGDSTTLKTVFSAYTAYTACTSYTAYIASTAYAVKMLHWLNSFGGKGLFCLYIYINMVIFDSVILCSFAYCLWN